MRMEPGHNNLIRCDNLYIFFNFNGYNWDYCQHIDPATVPAYHLFISDATSERNNLAIRGLMEVSEDLRQRWRKPITITLYAPMRHTVLRRFVEDYFEPYRKLFTSVFIDNEFRSPLYRLNHQPFAADGTAMSEQLIVSYNFTHPAYPTNMMTVGWEKGNGLFGTLGVFPCKPDDDWLASGHPGYR